jgi:hypothetical protein
MKLVQLSSTLVLASALFTSLMPISAVRADDSAFGKLADKIQCSDTSLGNNTRNNVGRNSSSSASNSSRNNSAWGNSSSSNASKKTHNDKGGGGVSILGGLFGASGSGGSQGSSANQASNSSAYGNSSASSNSNRKSNSSSYDRSTSTVVVGKNCDSNNEAAAYLGGKLIDRDINKDNVQGAVEITKIQGDVTKYGIDAQVKINSDNNKTAVDLFNAQRRSGAVNNLLQWNVPQR